MKTLGLIGGTSWESTIDYYRLLNAGVRDRLGGLHSCRLILTSVDFAEFVPFLHEGDWAGLGARLAAEARLLSGAGAQAIMLCTNTMHKVAAAVTAAAPLPFLDIRDAAGAALVRAGRRRPLLLGTRYTMEDDFFVAHLAKMGVSAIVPAAKDQLKIDRIIFEELVKGIVTPRACGIFLEIIARSPSADSVLLACTEIGMLLKPTDLIIPSFDTLRLHVEAALRFSLEENT